MNKKYPYWTTGFNPLGSAEYIPTMKVVSDT